MKFSFDDICVPNADADFMSCLPSSVLKSMTRKACEFFLKVFWRGLVRGGRNRESLHCRQTVGRIPPSAALRMFPGSGLSFSAARCFLQLGKRHHDSVHRRDRGHIQLEGLDLLHQVAHENRGANSARRREFRKVRSVIVGFL